MDTKSMIYKYVEEVSANFFNSDPEELTTSYISQYLNISRSLASQYLNELVQDGTINKVGNRPVYFICVPKIEQKLYKEIDWRKIDTIDDIYKLAEDEDDKYLEFNELVGFNSSLADIVKNLVMCATYPNRSLPIVINGESGTGKNALITALFHNINRIKYKGAKLEFDKIVLDATHTNIIDNLDNHKEKSLFLVIKNYEYLDIQSQKVLERIINGSSTHSNVLQLCLISSKENKKILSKSLQNYLAFEIKVPSLENRSIEEKQMIILHFLKEEKESIKRNILISTKALKVLLHHIYEDSIIGVKNAVKHIIALNILNNKDENTIYIRPEDLPIHFLRQDENISEEDGFIDIEHYEINEEIENLFNLLHQVFVDYLGTEDQDIQIRNLFNLSEYILSIHSTGKENKEIVHESVQKATQEILKYRNANYPISSNLLIAQLILMFRQHEISIHSWVSEHKKIMDEIDASLKVRHSYEYLLMDNIIKNLSMYGKYDELRLIKILMVIFWIQYVTNPKNRKVIGLIICHGFATASSIANSVNSLLKDYVFEAIDMPLDVNVEAIIHKANQFIEKINSVSDVVIMVDMGSLEDIADEINAKNRSIGVINNVSTKLALAIGEKIIQEKNIEEIMNLDFNSFNISSNLILKNTKKDAILITSENGVSMTHRLKEMYKASMPEQSQIELIELDYSMLINQRDIHPLFDEYNVIFISGTMHPHLETIPFISLEGIITSQGLEELNRVLLPYLSEEDINVLINNLRLNFTLNNVVKQITILNPVILLNHVSSAITNLEYALRKKFDGGTLIGIYIHVCCLVERLVTKSAVQDFDSLHDFSVQEENFIQQVQICFREISKHYNIQIPLSEVAYLHKYMNIKQTSLDGKTEGEF